MASDTVAERVAAGVIALVLLVASSAMAQGGDVVLLRNGGRLRGTVEVYEPGVRAVILLPDGSRRTIDASEIDRVQFADAPSTAEPTPPPVEATPTETAPVETAPTETAPTETTPTETAPAEPAPASGDALSGADLERLQSAAAAPSAVGEYGDGRAHEVPWNGVDPRARHNTQPDGMVHLVVEARFAFALLFNGFSYHGIHRDPWSLGGDIAGGADVRIPETSFHVRAQIVLGLQSHVVVSQRGEGWWASEHHRAATGFGYVAARALVGLDATSWLSVRAGGEYGFEVLPVFDVVRIYGGPEIDLTFRALDDRRLEVGVAVAFQDRSHAVVTSSLHDRSVRLNHAGTSWSPRIALTIGGVFL